jgi:hypothetical protein
MSHGCRPESFQGLGKIVGREVEIVVYQHAIEVKIGFPRDGDNCYRQDGRVEGVGADAAEYLFADENGEKSAGDDQPVGGRGRQQHAEQQTDQGRLPVAHRYGLLGHGIEQPFPADGAGHGQAQHAQSGDAEVRQPHDRCGNQGENDVVIAFGNPTAVVPEGRMRNDELLLIIHSLPPPVSCVRVQIWPA